MKFTKEQFDEIGPLYVNDFPINDDNQDLMLEVFNSIPSYEQGVAISWGCNDTVFRDNIFELLCRTQLNMSCKEYYASDIAKDYFENGTLIEIDLTKLRG